MIDYLPQCALNMDQLYGVTQIDRKYYMDKYFNMRNDDYLIQIYTRYGSNDAADKEMLEEFQARNIDLERGVH